MLVARKLDEIINSLELPEQCYKSMTTDNAANMKNACRDSYTIDKHLSCFDHTLNLVVNAGINSIDVIKSSVEKFKKLVSGCHKSNLYCERISIHLPVQLNQVELSINQSIYHLQSIYLSIYL